MAHAKGQYLVQPSLEICLPKSPAYPIYIEENLIKLPKILSELGKKKKHTHYFIITDQQLPSYIVQSFSTVLHQTFPEKFPFFSEPKKNPSILYMSGGEKSKNFIYLEGFYEKLLALKVDRRSCLIALGGGVVGDFCGFLAASLLRGIDFIQIPTTLLSLVDSSVGGKVGVNLSRGKNMVGAIHHPTLVYSSRDFLKTLPASEVLCGLAEVMKYSLLSKDFPSWPTEFSNDVSNDTSSRNVAEAFASLPWAGFHSIISASLRIKADVVFADEREDSLRAILNLGHTTAHAIESITQYSRFSHGEAVARGLVTTLFLSENLFSLSRTYIEQILHQMQVLALPRDTAGLTARDLYAAMRYDKKALGSKIKFVLLKEIAFPVWGQDVSFSDFAKAWEKQASEFG